LLGDLVLSLGSSTLSYGQARFITTRGKEFISPDGKSLLLKGINLGNWLLPEGYMFKFKGTNSPRLIQAAINELLAKKRRADSGKLTATITSPKQTFTSSSGLKFNSVRVPFSYRLFVSDGSVPTLEGPGYELLDRVIGWCRSEGLYVILDMHAAPGGQTGGQYRRQFRYPFLSKAVRVRS